MNCANHPDRERVAFCQNCGKPLCTECTRTVGSAVFCEPCLAARLAAADTATSASGTPYGNVNVPYGAPASAMPLVPGAPNPVLAGILGLIPGVGAMYNGQYAKGVVHLIVFAILVSLADTNGVFGLFVAGWVFYQGFEAYHTARARRDGTPLPNPFGLNDIGERFGFARSWTTATAEASAPAAAPYAPAPFAPNVYTSTAVPPPFSQVPHAEPPYGAAGYPAPGTYGNASWGATGGSYVPPMPQTNPYGMPFSPEAEIAERSNRFPVGALLLILFGVLFFFGSSGWLHGFPVHRIIPFVLIGIGIWIFVRKMTNTGLGMADDGSSAYRLRLFRALRGAIWVILVGILFFLDTFDILSWGHSWPLFIIVAGVMTLLERSAYNTAVSEPAGYTAYPAAGPASPITGAGSAPSAPTTSVVPSASHDEEGS